MNDSHIFQKKVRKKKGMPFYICRILVKVTVGKESCLRNAAPQLPRTLAHPLNTKNLTGLRLSCPTMFCRTLSRLSIALFLFL